MAEPIADQEFSHALNQLRLPIARGGWGLRSMEHTAPAAVLGSQLKFAQWVSSAPPPRQSLILAAALQAQEYSRQTYEQAREFVSEQYQIPSISIPPEQSSQDSNSAHPFAGIPSFDVLATWPTDSIPCQRQIGGHIHNWLYDRFEKTLEDFSRAHSQRLQALGKVTFKLDGQHTEVTHSPMALMAISSPHELPSEVFALVTAVQCGVRIPRQIFPAPRARSLTGDPYGDRTLNAHTSAARKVSHDAVVEAMTREIASKGLAVTCKPADIPLTNDPQHPDAHGDIHLLA